MHLKKNDLTRHLDALLSPALFEDYAPNGLQIDGCDQITRVGFAVSATQDSIREAIAWGAQALIVHHGVFWKHQGARTVTGAWGERLKSCIKAELNLFAYHLPLDAHPDFGNAAALAKSLGLENLEPFGKFKKQFIGTKGKFSPPISARNLKQQLEGLLQHQVMLASPDEEEAIETIGIITGGANNEWAEALSEGLDAYLTGEISEYNWHDSIEAGVHYFAGGHHATERPGIKALMEKVQSDFPWMEVRFFDSPNLA